MSSLEAKNTLAQKLQGLSPEKRALLARRLKLQAGDAPLGIQPIDRSNGADTFPLSFAQQRLWFLEQWEPGNSAYVQLFNLHLKGAPRPELLEKALNEIIRRHDSLRTTFTTVDGQPVQKIHPQLTLALLLLDLRERQAEARAAEVARLTLEDARKPFDLVQGPLIRAQLLRLADDEYRLLLTQHHIITDAWSLNLMLNELAALYTAYARGTPTPLPDLTLQYPDFAHWQRQWLQGPTLDKQMAFWRQKLAHLPTLDLPADHQRPAMQSYKGAKEFLTLPLPLANSLRALCQREGVTLFILAMAVFKVLLHRYTGQQSVAVGSPNANRARVETEPLMGFFTNTLVLHTDLSGNPTFREFLKRVKETALEAYAHQDVPFEKLVEELRPQRDLSRSPLFQILFQTITVPTEPIRLPDATLAYHEFDNKTAKFDLTLQVAEMVDGLVCTCEYSTDLFDPPTIHRLLGHFRTLLEGVVAAPEQRLASLPLLTEPERRQLFDTWNPPPPPAPSTDPRTLSDLVTAAAQKSADAIAVQCGDQHLTYRQLNERANRWAHALRKRGVGPDILVAVYVERSLDMIVSLLAIMKAGGAYVPIDPIYPRDRIAYILEDIQAPVLLTQAPLLARLPEHKAEVICMDRDWPQIAGESGDNPPSLSTPDNLAYVIFTSGSTGRPKGVQITHRTAVHLFESTRPLFNFSAADAWTVFHSFAFDFSVWEIWSPLTCGGRLIVIPMEVVQSPDDFYDLLCREKVTVVNLTPSAFRAVNESRSRSPHLPTALRMLVCGGEALPGDLVEALAQWKIAVWNFYGPTESTVWATCHKVDLTSRPDGAVSIGRPLPDNRLYVLDANLQALPVGIPGELHIGGAGLARGYLNRPELSAGQFIGDPFSPADRLYKTGDLARFSPDGTIQFLGRIDHQVKLRGFRIELGEIESVLAAHPGIASNVVVAREDTPGLPRLVAYLVRKAPDAPTPAELRTHLMVTLPEYMVPAAFVFLEALPLNSNGKIDRLALPAPELSLPNAARQFVAPRDELERQLVSLFEKVLAVRSVSTDDNFFDLGGHSLIAIRLFTQIQQIYGKKLPLSALFLAPTVQQLAAIIRQENWESPYKSLVPIQPRGTKPIFFCVHGAGGEVLFYNDLAKRLGEDQPFYALKARLAKEQKAGITLEEIAAGYLAEVRAMQPEGPYYLGGTSLGGVFAFEMAQQLQAQGQQVAFLAFFDAFHPQYLRYLPHVTALHRKVYGIYHVMENHLGALRLLEPGKRTPYIRSKVRRAYDEFLAEVDGVKRAVGQRVLKATRKQVPVQYRVFEHYLRSTVMQYRAKPYPGKVTIFRALRQPLGIQPDRTLGWDGLAAEFEILDVPGFHANIVSEPRVRFLIEKMQPALSAAREAFGVSVSGK